MVQPAVASSLGNAPEGYEDNDDSFLVISANTSVPKEDQGKSSPSTWISHVLGI